MLPPNVWSPSMSLGSTSELSALIAGYYEAVEDDSTWDTAWRRTLKVFDGTTGCLYLESPSALHEIPEFVSMPGFSPEAMALYGAYYVNVDPYAAMNRTTPNGQIFLSQEVIAPSKFRESEIYVDLCSKTFGGFHIVAAGVELGGGRAARISLHRPYDAQPFDRPEARLFSIILPHVTQALRLRRKLAEERRATGAYAAAVDAMVTGVVVLDRTGRILFANAAAESLAAAGHIQLGRKGEQVRLPVHEDLRRLRRLVQAVANGLPGGSLMASSCGGAAQVAMTVSPLPKVMASRVAADLGTVDNLVLVVARDIRTAIALDPKVLGELFGLTAVEAEIATCLARGMSVEAIADARGRSLPTLRSQVRQILQKTGAQSLRHLIGMLGMLP